MTLFLKLKTVKSTPFSDFIHHASSAKKMCVYSEVMKKMTERQLGIIKRVNSESNSLYQELIFSNTKLIARYLKSYSLKLTSATVLLIVCTE